MYYVRPSLACVFFLFSVTAARADILSDISTNVKKNTAAVIDMSATLDVRYTNGAKGWDDFVGAAFKRKGRMFLIEGAGTDPRKIRTDGKSFWNMDCGGPVGTWTVIPYHIWQEMSTDSFEDMCDINTLLDANHWALDSEKHQINGISCYKLSAGKYLLYVDVATKTKVIRVEYSGGYYSNQSADFSDYRYLKSTAYVAGGIKYVYGAVVTEFSLSDISINDNLADSLFEVADAH
jgi:outer membrane lipoprotein-sorting protein